MELTIEKMVYGGDGLARYSAPGETRAKTVFVPFVLEGERVSASPVDTKPSFIRAQSEKILAASPLRIQPKCPYFTECGGCHYQHAGYEHQLEIKCQILRETLRRTASLDWDGEIITHASPPWNYRNRTSMKLRHQPFALGYYKFNSHTLLPVERCPISSPLINRAIGGLWELGRAGAIPPEIAEVEFFANAEDTELLLELYLRPTTAPRAHHDALATFADAALHSVPQLQGLAYFDFAGNAPALPHSLPAPLQTRLQSQSLIYRVGDFNYRVSAGSFFQTNRFLIDTLQELAVPEQNGERALDLYAGAGLFSLALANSFQQVTAVESAPASFRDLVHNSPPNVLAKSSEAQQFLSALNPLDKFDFVIADPPRAGLGNTVARQLVGLAAPQLTYVSCDPATLARDLKILLEGGYRLQQLYLVDLFPQTYHLETVARLVR